MSLFNNLRTLGRKDKVSVELTLADGNVLDLGYFPGSRLRNLNDFVLELDVAANSKEIVKIKVDDYIISFE